MWLGGRRGRRAAAAAAAGLLAACAAAGLLAASAAAEVTVFDAYETLLQRERAPLVPVSFPAALQPVGSIEVLDEYASHGRYGEIFTRFGAAGKRPLPTVLGNLVFSDYGAFSLAREVRIARRHNHVSPVSVRGGRGWLLRARHGGSLALLWSERGALYALSTGTAKAIPLSVLQSTAAGLDRLTGEVRGETPPPTGYAAPNLGAQATALVGERSALIATGWSPQCQEAPLGALTPGGARTILSVTLAGTSLGFGPAPVTAEELIEGETASWTLALSGNISAAGGQLTEQASGSSNGEPCSLAPTTFALAPFHEP